MVGCRLRSLICFFACSSVLLLGASLNDVEASSCQRVIHKKVGDTVELSSCLPADGVTAATWYHGKLSIADKDGTSVVDHQFKGRFDLNPTNFSLTLRKLTLQDSGDFSFVSEDSVRQRETIIITLQVHVSNRAVVILRPDWPEIYYGDSITLTCEIEDGGDTEWEYKWTLPRSKTPPKHKEYKITSASSSHTGNYSCQGKMRNGQSTNWSEAFTLKVSNNVPQSVLTVSPLWLIPGDSVTLNCEVKHPSSGWRFYFYKAVPKLSQNYYSFEFLPGSSNGTEQDSYIVHGQNHTSAYTCRAGRGNPVYLTSYSALKFVWSGDFHSAASLTVSPDRVQHFIKDSVSLSCKGNSTKWRVRGFSKSGYLFTCSDWSTVTGFTCNFRSSHSTDGVFWCESETGQFSNAVSISKTNTNVILVSPVHPVAEGDSVTLVCKFKTENVSPIVDFYKNSELIQNDSRRELMISAVSKSDEGFYKCKGKDFQLVSYTSSQSWLSVKSSDPKNVPLPALWIVGPVCGVFFNVLLLLFLCFCTRSKDSCFCEPMKCPEAVENDESSCVTYCFVELKEIAKKGKAIKPEEGAAYTDLRKESASDTTLMYVQVCSYDEVNVDKLCPHV